MDYLFLSSYSKNQENKLMDSLQKYRQIFQTCLTFVPWAIWQMMEFKQGVCSSAKFTFRKLSGKTPLHCFQGSAKLFGADISVMPHTWLCPRH